MIKNKTISILSAIGFIVLLSSFYKSANISTLIEQDKNVYDLLMEFGETAPIHHVQNTDPELTKKGKEIILYGTTIGPNGKKTKLQSRHFRCNSCHNLEKEDPNLSINNPEDRLNYAKKKDIPFLPGTTLYGTVNRSQWYNGDYYKKYGNLVVPARDTLQNAIQLCATECSKGRAFTDWEMKAVLNYLWSIQLKISDLNLTNEELNEISGTNISNTEKIKLIKSKYLDRSDATFSSPIPFKNRKFGDSGNPNHGKEILERSCVYCHSPEKEISKYKIDLNNHLKIKQLLKSVNKNNNHSIYNISREGFYPVGSRQAYMPHYSIQRLSDQQIEDIVAFLKMEAKTP